MIIQFAGLVRCVNRDGQLLFWCTPEAAQIHIDAGDARRVGTKKRARALVWTAAPIPTAEERARSARLEDRQRYRDFTEAHWSKAHDRETDRNPPRVWTLESIEAPEKRWAA